ncbi:MAG: hypothetical protein RL136_801 [Planctomycetota bacterium]
MTSPYDPTNPHKAPPRRPAVLDSVRIPGDTEGAESATGREAIGSDDGVRPQAAPPPMAESRAAPIDDDAPLPCPACGYDLRGRSRSIRCPECGAKVPRTLRLPPSPHERLFLRESLSLGWRALANPSIAPAILLTPLPALLPFGPAVAVAAGFAPAFRLLGIRAFDAMPDELRLHFAPDFAHFRRRQMVELALVGAITLIAACWTFGLALPLLAPLYELLLVVWWIAALWGLFRQVSLGHALALRLADHALLPDRATARLRRTLLLAIAIGATGFAATLAAALLTHIVPAAAPLVSLGSLVVLGGAALGGYGCLLARGHAIMVAECIFESDLLKRTDAERRREEALAFVEAERTLVEAQPEAAPESADATTQPRNRGGDDEYIPLA